MNYFDPADISTTYFDVRINQLLDLLRAKTVYDDHVYIKMHHGDTPISKDEFSLFKNEAIVSQLNKYNMLYNDLKKSKDKPELVISLPHPLPVSSGIYGLLELYVGDYEGSKELISKEIITKKEAILFLDVFGDYLIFYNGNDIIIPPYIPHIKG